MKTLITPSKGGFRIHMPDRHRRHAETLGAFACMQLQNQDPTRWAMASDGEFLGMVKQGAQILREIGLYATIDLSETEAHLAFMSCRFLALRAELLSAGQRRSLQQLFLILSRCCFISLGSQQQSALGSSDYCSKLSPDLQRAYQRLKCGKPVLLSTATRLWTVLDRIEASRRRFNQQLGEATFGFRTSLLQLSSHTDGKFPKLK